MDPLTLLAAANAAVAAVKKGCQLYKDIKGAAGDVKGVLDDLKKQFESKPNRTPAEKQQYLAEVQRVQEVSKADPNDTIGQIGDHLGKFFDALDQVEALFWEEEIAATKVYAGDVSLSRRALQRVLIRTRLEQLQAEIREEMVYRTPPELKDLYTRFEKMREQILKEQKEAKEVELRQRQIAAQRKARRLEEIKEHALWIAAVAYVVAWGVGVLLYLRFGATFRGYY